MKFASGTIVTALMVMVLSSHAQVVEKKSLNLEGANKAIAAAIDYAKKNNAPGGVIAVVDDGGNLMALERLDGTFAMGATISIGKARTAVLFKKPTRFFEELINKGRTAMTAVDGFTPLIGGIPIVIDGQVVGGIGVSGAASANQDEELALAGATVFSQPTKTDPISKSPSPNDVSGAPMMNATNNISPQGKHLGTIIPPKHPHNFAWGDADGKTLYLCAKSGLYRLRLNIEGVRP